MTQTYKDAGVDIDAGNAAVERIRKRVRSTFSYAPGKVLSDLSGFSAIVERSDGSIMGATTDGVGTKLMIAMLLDRPDTVGIDLVAMCVNDLVASGLTPTLFLDYIAQGRQVPARTERIVDGMVEGCKDAQVALLGGEMAEMPGMYSPDEYDLAGFAIGEASSRDELVTGERIKPGMPLYGIFSNGVHANGFSLLRKLFGVDEHDPAAAVRALEHYHAELGQTLGEEFLRPTRIYVRTVKELRKRYDIAGIVHVTGGGFADNPPRIMPDGCAAQIDLDSWEAPPIFQMVARHASLSELLRTFNLGIGMLLVSPDEIRSKKVVRVGTVVAKDDKTTQYHGGHQFFP